MTGPAESEDFGPIIDYAARRQDRRVAHQRSNRRRVAIVAAASLVALLGFASGVEALVTAGRVHPGVTVSGVRLGGMKPGAAAAALRTNLPGRVSDPVSVTDGEKSWTVTAGDIGLSFDYEGEAARAMSVGREGGFFRVLGDRARAYTRGVDLVPDAQGDLERMDKVIAGIAKDTDIAPVDASVKIEGAVPTPVDGKDGRALQRTLVSRLILKAFTSKDKEIVAPVSVDNMAVDLAAAKDAASVAEAMLASPVTITYEKKTWEFSPKEIAKWLSFESVSELASGTAQAGGRRKLDVSISPKLAGKPIASALGTDVGRPAANATFRTSNGRVTIIPSKDGIGPDVEALALSLTDELKDGSSDRVVELRTRTTQPEITTEKARSMGIRERISTYTTEYGADNKPRVTNIHLLGDALDGELIEPGGVFSFNEAAGERTAEKGYQEANAIVNGKLVPQLGGGVCQVGTTVFNAVFESGLPVLERRNHSFYISHYPKGRDATVSWGGPDLKFKNDTEHWVLVSVSYTSSSITVSIYGTDPGYEVTSETSDWSKIKPFPIEEVKDPTMPEGSRAIEDAGITGRTCTVKRTVSKGGKVLRTDEFVSNYKPKSQVVRVGTKRVAPQKTTVSP